MQLIHRLTNSSRQLADEIAASILKQPELLAQAVELSKTGVKLIPMRVSRVVYLVHQQAPELFKPYWETLFHTLLTTNNESVRRNFLNLFLSALPQLTEEQGIELFDKSLEWVVSTKEKIAVRGLSVKIIVLFAEKYPELQNEIESVLDRVIYTADASLLAMAKTGLAQIKRKNSLKSKPRYSAKNRKTSRT